mmetsp:Transcript_64467/g.203806  ORF Transcript_64467/g.203806 Transcript_64467/m.203806 type:complete len:470 (-) Transcript_64467:96-1505(-)
MRRALVGCVLAGVVCAAQPACASPAHLEEEWEDSEVAMSAVSLIQVSLKRQAPPYFWAGKNGDISRTGASASVAPSNISGGPAWRFDGGLVRATPLIDAAKAVYFATIPGRVYKFSPEGKILWQWAASAQIPSVPAIANGRLFAASADGMVTALDMATGEPLWSTKAGLCAAGDTWSVTADSSVVVVPVAGAAAHCSYNSEIVALDAQDGGVRWRHRPDTGVYNFLSAIVEDSLVFADSSGRPYRLDLADGRELWKFADTSLSDLTTGGAAVGPNRVVYVTSNVGNMFNVQQKVGHGRLSAYSLDSGQRLWYRDLELQANGAAAIGILRPGGKGPLSVVVGIGENPNSIPQRAGHKEGLVVAFDATTGRRLDWSYAPPVWQFVAAAGDTPTHICLPDAFSNPAIDGDGTVYVGFQDGRIYAVRDADGDGKVSDSEVSAHDTGAAFQASPAIAPDMLAAASCSGLFVYKG